MKMEESGAMWILWKSFGTEWDMSNWDSSQNLHNQASRLEKMKSNATAGTVERDATMDAILSTTRSDCTTQDFADHHHHHYYYSS